MAKDKRYITFTVPGKPLGKQRPRFSRQGTAVRTYTPTELSITSFIIWDTKELGASYALWQINEKSKEIS